MTLSDMVYPNPGNDTCILMLNDQENEQLHVSMRDVKGRLMEQHDLTLKGNSEIKQLHLEHAPKGLYLVKVSNGTRLQTQKIVKEGV